MPGPTYQYARYLDWIIEYVPYQKQRLVIGTDMAINSEESIKILTVLEADIPLIERQCVPLIEEWQKARAEADQGDFEGYQESSLIGK